MLKEGWKQVTLAEISDSIDYGYTHAASPTPKGPKFLRITDIVGGYVDWRSVPHCPVEKHILEKYRLRDGDIVVARTGASTGISYYVKDPPEAIFASYLVRYRIRRDVDSRFVAYYLKSPEFWAYMKGVLGDKSAQPNASATTIGRAPILLPPLPEQRAIAHILGTLDDKIELLRRMSETLEEMARALFKAWFVDFVPVRAKMEGRWKRGQSLPGLPAHLYDLFPDRLVPSELGEIPEGWEVGVLGQVAENPRRTVQPEEIEPSTPYIALEHMPKRRIALAEWSTAKDVESNKFQFKQGEILFGKLRPYFHKVGVAPIDGVCSTDILVVTPRTSSWFGFVLGHVSSIEFVEYTNAGATGTRMPRTSWADMSRYPLVLPPESVAIAFNTMILPMVQRIIASVHETRTLAALRDALLPKLVSGEVRVKDAERFLTEQGV